MGNSKASSIAQLPVAESPVTTELGSEQARAFHFAVTWVGLFAHLDPVEATGPRQLPEAPSASLALVPVVVPAPFVQQGVVEQRAEPRAAGQRTGQDSNSAWEMVVPKMIRTGSGNFTPPEGSDPRLL